MEQTLSFDRNAYIEQLQSIHGLRDLLGLTDYEYRDLLGRLTGSRSAKYMTPLQRQRVITFMSVHKAIDEALERLEHARDTLNETFGESPASTIQKIVSLDGQREATMNASVEEVIETMRNLHGSDVRLVGAQEKRLGPKTVLELAFERPAVLLKVA